MKVDNRDQGASPRRSRLAAALALGFCLIEMACVPHQVETDPSAAAPPPPVAAPDPAAAVQLPSFADVVQKVIPAVVNITAVGTHPTDEEEEPESGENAPEFGPNGQSPFEEFLRRFFGPQGPLANPNRTTRVAALGSGFIIDPAGYVVTDQHVIANADRVMVVLQDNSRYPAKIVGQDQISDIALLKIEAGKPLPFATWGNSDAARVGDWILAVGNPFGLGGTVTAGIISARGRDIRVGPSEEFLQIDAPLNRGNSGGPTFNLAGQVIGMNTAIYTPSGGSVGIGFAIPSNLARPIVEELRAHGRVERGWLGVELQEVTPSIAESFGLTKPVGALVTNVIPGGPADKAGLRQGDVVLAFNGHPVSEPRDLVTGVAGARVGSAASVQIWRMSRTITLHPTIAERSEQPLQPAPAGPPQPQTATSMGLRLAPLDDVLRRTLHLPATAMGVVVMEIDDGSPLADSGLSTGDVIEEIDHHEVTTPKAAAQRLDQALSARQQRVLLLINRHGSKAYLAAALRLGGEPPAESPE